MVCKNKPKKDAWIYIFLIVRPCCCALAALLMGSSRLTVILPFHFIYVLCRQIYFAITTKLRPRSIRGRSKNFETSRNKVNNTNFTEAGKQSIVVVRAVVDGVQYKYKYTHYNIVLTHYTAPSKLRGNIIDYRAKLRGMIQFVNSIQFVEFSYVTQCIIPR